MSLDASNSPMTPDPEPLLAEAERLIWALLDDNLDDADAARLTTMMEEDAAVRARYVECVQMHIDLAVHFNGPSVAALRPAPATVLSNLWSGGTPGSSNVPAGE